MGKTSSKQFGWYGETLDVVLDRRPANAVRPGTKLAPVGFDPAALARLLG